MVGDLEHLLGGQRQRPRVQRRGTGHQIRMRAGTERRGIRALVGRHDRLGEAVCAQPVGGLHAHTPRVPRLRHDHGGQRHRVFGAVDDREVEPDREAVQRVRAADVAERELVRMSAERVRAVDDAVRPGSERGAAVAGTHLVGRERHDQVAPVDGERTQRRADAGDVRFVGSEAEGEVGARDGNGRGRRGRCLWHRQHRSVRAGRRWRPAGREYSTTGSRSPGTEPRRVPRRRARERRGQR